MDLQMMLVTCRVSKLGMQRVAKWLFMHIFVHITEIGHIQQKCAQNEVICDWRVTGNLGL